jgi:hypothetical protein
MQRFLPAAGLGVLVPIALLVRSLLLRRRFGRILELLLYPDSIFLFDESRHSSLYGLTTSGLSLIATVAPYAFAAMISERYLWGTKMAPCELDNPRTIGV